MFRSNISCLVCQKSGCYHSSALTDSKQKGSRFDLQSLPSTWRYPWGKMPFNHDQCKTFYQTAALSLTRCLTHPKNNSLSYAASLAHCINLSLSFITRCLTRPLFLSLSRSLSLTHSLTHSLAHCINLSPVPPCSQTHLFPWYNTRCPWPPCAASLCCPNSVCA